MVFTKITKDNSRFVVPVNASVTISLRLWATAPSSGQTKVQLSSNPVNNCVIYIISWHWNDEALDYFTDVGQ